MPKTLHSISSLQTKQPPGPLPLHEEDQLLTGLLHEMKHFLKDASTDLLQPRPEALTRLLDQASDR